MGMVYEKVCADCGSDFSSKVAHAKYCVKCRKPGVGGARRLQRTPERMKQKVCPGCGVTFGAYRSDTKYCSRSCAGIHASKEFHTRRKLLTVERKVYRRWANSPRIRKYAKRLTKRREARQAVCNTWLTCPECGGKFRDLHQRNKKYCSTRCARREGKRARNKKNRAKLRGAKTETVLALKVFERDGWRCQLCGTKTLQHLRGSYKKRAPEWDHIVPISKGGEHSYSNTQFSCRACNAAKSAQILGQIPLFPI